MKTIGIIGAGLSSLYAACKLAKEGHQVTVFEKNSQPGGRSQTFTESGFTFDMGPSWYWMPELIDRLFDELEEDRTEYYKLERLDPSYRVYWKEDNPTDVYAEPTRLFNLFDEFEENGAEKLRSFLDDAETKYNIAISDFLENPGLSISEIMKIKALKSAIHLDVFKSVEKDVSKRFTSDKARSILNFPVLFLGAMPKRIPALYTLMNYADLRLGTWYPEGGMSALAKALEKIAKKHGVVFHYNQPVEQILHSDKKVHGLSINGVQHHFNYVVSGADYHHTEQKLLSPEFRKYTPDYWDKRELAPSSLIFYLGVNKKLDNLSHHNLFFDEDLNEHGNEIYHSKQWPEKPLFYVCAPSKSDNAVAPKDHENLFVLIPIAPDLKDEDEIRRYYLSLIIERIKNKTGEDISDHIVVNRSFCVSDFKEQYNSFKGNAYGLANTLLQTANLKPKMKSKLENLYYCGQLTVPGPGIPPALISGKIAANQIIKKL